MYLTLISFQNVTSAFNESKLFMSQWNVSHEESFLLKRFYPLPTLCVKCPYSELFWSAFSRIRTEYGEIRSNADKNNFEYGHFWRSAIFVKMLHHRCLTGFWIRFWCIHHQQYFTEFIRVNPGQTWSFTKNAGATCFKINPGIKTTNTITKLFHHSKIVFVIEFSSDWGLTMLIQLAQQINLTEPIRFILEAAI